MQPATRPPSLLRRKSLLTALALLLTAVTLDVAVRVQAVPRALALRNLFAVHVKTDAPPAVSEAERRAASDFYLRGRYEWDQRTPASLHRALDLFTQAIVHNPGDARAYAGLADTYDLLREYSTDADSDAFPRAIAAAKKAVALDDSLAEAHRALAFALMYGVWDFAGAEAEFRRAIALDPKDSQARRWFANALSVGGRSSEGLAQMDKAQELDPTSHATLADKGWMLYNANRGQEGIELLKEVERSAPDFYSPHSYLMQIALDQRDYPAFLSEGQLAAQSSGDAALLDTIASARAGNAQGGSRGLLQALYTKEKHYYAAGQSHVLLLARVCLLMGRRQEALQAMEDAYLRKDIDVLAFLSQPDLLVLKDDPRYQVLARKINFPRAPLSRTGLPKGF
jgi:Tfp pilus assembly protein PilF